MASVTAIAKSERAPRAWRFDLWRGSRLGRTIIALQVIGLLVLVIGALILNETRQGLVTAQAEALRTEADLIAQLISVAATEGEPEPLLDADEARYFVYQLHIPPTQRLRVFDAWGDVLADSYVVNDRIEERTLPPLRRPGGVFTIQPGAEDQADPRDLQRAAAELEREARRAISDGPTAGTRHTASGARVVSVSVPIEHVRAVLGVLTIEGGDVDAIIVRQRAALLPFILIAALVTLASSLLLNIVIARPVRKLAREADRVRLSRARSISLPEVSARDDELGDLGRSLETMTQALSERMDAIERFAADVSHEIRNPLTSVRSAVETLELVTDDATRHKLVGILKQDVARLDRLITDISNASRLDAELSRDEPRSVDIGRLLHDIVGLYDASAQSGPAVIFADSAEKLEVAGREGPLGQVFRNLIDNARSFTVLARKKDAAVRVSAHSEGREVRVTVEDDGPGIPPENLESIFERFYTSRPREARGRGSVGNSGLGLSIARQITLAHNGRIWAENRTDEEGRILGARFVVALPARHTK